MAEKVGEIYYEVGADIAPLLQGAKQVDYALDGMGDSAERTSGRVKRLDSASQNAGKSLVRAANDGSQAAKMMESLGNEIAILEERQQKGARAAVILAAELRAGSGATAAQRKEIATLTGQLYDMKKAQDGATSSTERAAASSSKVEMALSRVGIAIAGAFTLQAMERLISIADEMATLEARVNRLSPSVESAKNTISSLSTIASQTGNSLKETERLWETLTSSLKEAGATNGQILALTDTLQKIGTIGGSSSEEMANALRQFGQSIAGGTVRAEEFNSIIEQMPELARTMAAGLGISVGELRKRMLEGKLTAEDALNAIMSQTSKVNEEFSKMPVSVERAKNSLDVAFKNVISDLNESIGLTQRLAGAMVQLSNNLNYFNKNVGDTGRMPKLLELQKQYTKEVQEGQKWWETQTVYQQRVGQAAFNLKNVEGEIRSIRASSTKELQTQSKINIPKPAGDSKEVEKLEKNTKRKLELSRLEGEARARLQAQYDAEDAGIKDSNRIKALQDEYAATERNTSAMKASNAEGKKAASTQESINKKLEELRQKSEVSASSTAELSREQTILRAQQSLGNEATQEQIQLAGQYAAKAYDTAAALKAQAAAEKQKQQVQKDFSAIQNQASPITGLDNSYQKQLATIEQYKQLYPQKIAEAEAARAAIEKQYRDQRINLMWQEWEQQSTATQVAGAAFEAFGSTASNALTGLISGTMSLGDAMRSIGNAVLNAIIDTFVQMGIQWAKSAILGATTQQTAIAATTAAQTAAVATQTAVSTTAAATTAAAWTPAAILSSIASMGTAAAIGLGAVAGVIGMNLLGKRKNGGPVSAGGLYQVGESGLPEIYQASNGRQYMIPGDNGSVISNKDLQGGGGINVQLNVQNYSGATVDAQASSDGNGGVTIDMIVADLNNGGPVSQGIVSNFNVKRKARGQG
ncbi:tape measure protein [Mixta calida]|uniref:tape measure protein n=1 Tax=Mixta calida TaxID=665913 RepID=UPI0034D69938